MKLSIEMFAIRHIPSGHYLPSGYGHNGRGGTYQEPVPASVDCLPRFFDNRKTAMRALQAWLRGIYESEREEYGTYWSKITPVPSRKAEDMEIVPITLELS